MKKPRALVLCGDGINCDGETAWALETAGFEPARLHTTSFLDNPETLSQIQLLVIPGGFSFGDEIASGKILALKIKRKMRDALTAFIGKGGLVIGICNGFQVLVQMGLLPFSEPGAPRVVSLTRNAEGRFVNRWVELDVKPSNPSPFFESLSRIHLPIRHGEGRLAVGNAQDTNAAAEVSRHAALRYVEDVNGSHEKIAALTNTKGNVLGLMPHPEAFVRWSQHPAWASWSRQSAAHGSGLSRHPQFPDGPPDGLVILKNARKAVD